MTKCDCRTVADRTEVVLAGILLEQRHQLGHAVDLQLQIDRQRAGLADQLCDRRDIRARIVRQFRNSNVLMASGPPMLMPMVAPSGAAFATKSVPRLPLAPGLFSTRKTLSGYFFAKPSETSRATMSGVDPGPNGTSMRTVFGGHAGAAVCADAGAVAASNSNSGIMTRLTKDGAKLRSLSVSHAALRLSLAAFFGRLHRPRRSSTPLFRNVTAVCK